MRRVIFITGHHRGGTHEFADYIAKETGLYKVDEDLYMFDHMDLVNLLLDGKMRKRDNDGKIVDVSIPLLQNGWVLQCPGLAAFTPRLAELGEVYWCYRNPEHIATSMANGGFNKLLWQIMETFHKQFPDDPIWAKLKYKDREDPHSGFIGYAYLLTNVKEYFFDKYFKKLVTDRVLLEDQPYYDFNKTATSARPPKQHGLDRIAKVRGENETLCAS